MLPYATLPEAEEVLGRSLTALESLWLRYSAGIPDYVLYCHSILFLFLAFTLAPLPLTLLELYFPRLLARYKLQPKSPVPMPSSFLRCYIDVAKVFFLVVGPLQLASYPAVKWIGVRTGLPLPSWHEVVAQLVVYFLVEDFGNYWIHRWMHCRWGYDNIHRVHHEYTAPFGFAATYAHWAEVLVLGIPSFAGPAMVPCHMLTFWAWIVLRQLEAIETHTGYDFPLNPTKLIPFYGGAEHHDYHHYVGGQSQSNFASVFTYCDVIYGTDKGYRYHKTQLSKLKEQRRLSQQDESVMKPAQKYD